METTFGTLLGSPGHDRSGQLCGSGVACKERLCRSARVESVAFLDDLADPLRPLSVPIRPLSGDSGGTDICCCFRSRFPLPGYAPETRAALAALRRDSGR
jgi:hypothetical protein